MSSPLEKFILENREKFDADAPDPAVWEKINERMNPEEAVKVKPIQPIPFRRWLAVAAAVLLVVSTGIIYYSMHPNKITDLAGNGPVHIDSNNHLPVINPPADTQKLTDKNATTPQKINAGNIANIEQAKDSTVEGENKEMYYYAKLIELKHDELKTLEKDEPLLYRQFAGDVRKLDSVYHSLKTQLPNNSNREQVIEAMISNLQLQIGLLNRQLDIIKQIKHSKKSAYEKAYKSV
jgi:hypothetical protein